MLITLFTFRSNPPSPFIFLCGSITKKSSSTRYSFFYLNLSFFLIFLYNIGKNNQINLKPIFGQVSTTEPYSWSRRGSVSGIGHRREAKVKSRRGPTNPTNNISLFSQIFRLDYQIIKKKSAPVFIKVQNSKTVNYIKFLISFILFS